MMRSPCLHTSSASPVIRGLHLSRTFGQGATASAALKGVSLDLYPGQFVLLMGPSGSGKSTLLAMLSGLLRPTAGQVITLGHDLWTLSDAQREELRLEHTGFVFQGHNLLPMLTASQQLEIVLRWCNAMPAKEARHRASAMLDLLGLHGQQHLYPDELSGGEKQRVSLGRALVKTPTICFADEPTSALDWGHGEHVARLLHDIARKKGAMVLVVSHDSRLIQFADTVYNLEDGRLIDDLSCRAPVPSPGIASLVGGTNESVQS